MTEMAKAIHNKFFKCSVPMKVSVHTSDTLRYCISVVPAIMGGEKLNRQLRVHLIGTNDGHHPNHILYEANMPNGGNLYNDVVVVTGLDNGFNLPCINIIPYWIMGNNCEKQPHAISHSLSKSYGESELVWAFRDDLDVFAWITTEMPSIDDITCHILNVRRDTKPINQKIKGDNSHARGAYKSKK
ncbi:hypothetical protein IEQ34_022206 [Dendrobium chrysotoxum]|uniref:Uncharacterized protein n=1 Tax=Dendrobium chrysotoxum TaxID=161865 RepID=A0AAV7FWK7_DENCH|nr:hypothetical protein IEQ34_022206 [Dendrobium chrysotoxum]